MRRAAAVLVVVTSIVSMLMTGCAGGEKAISLEMDRLQSSSGEFQFYDLGWESSPDTVQETLGIAFGQPDTAGDFQIYSAENAYTWDNETASITCEYGSDRLYTVTLRFMPRESERDRFWSSLKEELFSLYGTVEESVQTGASENLNITSESENYLWEDPNSQETLLTLSRFSLNGEFKYISLSVSVSKNRLLQSIQ